MSMIIRQDAASQRYFRRGSPHNKDKPPNEESISNDIKNEREKIMKKMKKSFKKVLAQMLVLAMCLTMLPMAKTSVKAAGPTGPAQLIDSSATGSITVTKYATVSKTIDSNALDSNAPLTTGNNGTGIETGLPSGATGYEPLAGAKFNLYQIATTAEVMDFYNGRNNTEYKIADYSYINGVAKYGTETLTVLKTGLTADTTGKLTFNELPVGIYVLQEVEANDQITAPLCDPCLVSIPMVNSATSSNLENKEWIYDVNVFPKNHEATATVEIFKQDQNGKGLNGAKFALYRKPMLDKDGTIDADASWTEVTVYDVNSQNASKDYATFITATKAADGTNPALDGYLKIDNIPATFWGAQYKLEEIEAPEGYTVNSTPIYFKVLRDNTVVYNTDTDTAFPNKNTAVLSHPTEANDLDLTIRNERSFVEKVVLENLAASAPATATASEWKTDEQFRMDDVITYRVTSYVPYNAQEIHFKIEDTLSDGLKLTAIKSVMAGVIGSDGKPKCDVDITSSTAKYDLNSSENGFTFEVNEDSDENVLGKCVEITYTAIMTKDAVIAKEGNSNVVKVTYDNKIDPSGSVPTYTISDEVRVYTYEYQITKTLDTLDGTKAEGVVFNLYDAKDNKLNVVLINASNPGYYRLALNGESVSNSDLVTNANGFISIQGLEKDTYYLKEIQTVPNYNLLSGNYDFEIAVVETTAWDKSKNSYGASEMVVKTYDTVNKTSYNGGNVAEDASLTVTTIVNKKGFVLPQTGSMGYLLFCVAGILLVFGGAVLMFSGRKKTIR